MPFVEANDIRPQLDHVTVGKSRWRDERLTIQSNSRSGIEIFEHEPAVTLPNDFRMLKRYVLIHLPYEG